MTDGRPWREDRENNRGAYRDECTHGCRHGHRLCHAYQEGKCCFGDSVTSCPHGYHVTQEQYSKQARSYERELEKRQREQAQPKTTTSQKRQRETGKDDDPEEEESPKRMRGDEPRAKSHSRMHKEPPIKDAKTNHKDTFQKRGNDQATSHPCGDHHEERQHDAYRALALSRLRFKKDETPSVDQIKTNFLSRSRKKREGRDNVATQVALTKSMKFLMDQVSK